MAKLFGIDVEVNSFIPETGALELGSDDTPRWEIATSTGHLLPKAGLTYNIGSVSLAVNQIWAQSLLHNGGLTIGTTGNAHLVLQTANAAKWQVEFSTGDFQRKHQGGTTTGVFGSDVDGSVNNVRTQLIASDAGSTLETPIIQLNSTNLDGILRLIASSTGNIVFADDGDSSVWEIDHNNGALINSQTVGLIRSNTSDGADTSVIQIAGGGAAANTRGGRIEVYGNENGNPGNIYLRAGAPSGKIVLYTNGSARWEANSSGHLTPAADDTYDIGAPANNVRVLYTTATYRDGGILALGTLSNHNVQVLTNSGVKWQWTNTGHFVPLVNEAYDIGSTGTRVRDLHIGGNLIGLAKMIASTSDGSDNESLFLAGGGNDSNDRGALIRLHGNEHSTDAGQVNITGGTAAGASVDIQTSTTAAIRFFTNSSHRWNILSSGHISPNGDDTYDIGEVASRVRDIYTNGAVTTFTGAHIYKLSTTNTPSEGDAVKLISRQLQKCTSAEDKACIGVLTSKVITASISKPVFDGFNDNHTSGDFSVVASTGDTRTGNLIGAKLCDEGGAIEDGDLLVTASKAGFLKKQSDDVVRGNTVAQARETVSFDGNGEATGQYVYILK